jgi:cephalosporin-C deacetylase
MLLNTLAKPWSAEWNPAMKPCLALRVFVSFLAGWFLAQVPPALGAETNTPPAHYLLTVRAERPNAIYRRGETVTFDICLQMDDQPADGAQVDWTISKDGVPPITGGSLKLVHGRGTLAGKLDYPGFLQCRVVFRTPGGGTLSALGGAGVDPLQIQPSLPIPEHFDAFWSAQKQKLAAVPINPRLTPVHSPQPEVECFDLQADCLGAPVSGYFARPAGAKPKSLPTILTVHGAGVSSSSLGGTVGWAGRGFLALDLNAHGIPNGQPAKFYTGLANGELKDYRTRGRESRDTIYFLGMFLRLVRAIDFLTGQPEWDGHTLVVHGSSQGGAQSIVAAGLDSRVTFFAAGVPAMCDHTGAVVGRTSGWPKLVPSDADGKPDAGVLEVARYYDAVNFATRTRAAGILTVGFIDTVCPPTGVYAAYNALKGKKEIFNDPPSKHTVSSPANQAMRAAILRHVQAMKNGSEHSRLN